MRSTDLLVAGLILKAASLRWIFAINLPLVVGGLPLIAVAVPATARAPPSA